MGQVLTRKFEKQVFMVRVGSSPPRVVYRLKGLEKWKIGTKNEEKADIVSVARGGDSAGTIHQPKLKVSLQ